MSTKSKVFKIKNYKFALKFEKDEAKNRVCWIKGASSLPAATLALVTHLNQLDEDPPDYELLKEEEVTV
jgi:hypothetical protein